MNQRALWQVKHGKWCPGAEFDASYKRQLVTESSYINSLAIRTYRSTVKTLPATLPEPWAAIRGQSSKVQASRLVPRGRRTGVTWDGCWIWSELVQGVGLGLRCVQIHSDDLSLELIAASTGSQLLSLPCLYSVIEGYQGLSFLFSIHRKSGL